jgi:hypothetical protein
MFLGHNCACQIRCLLRSSSFNDNTYKYIAQYHFDRSSQLVVGQHSKHLLDSLFANVMSTLDNFYQSCQMWNMFAQHEGCQHLVA